MPAEGFAGPAVEFMGNSVKPVLSNTSQAPTLRKVLAEESVGVLVAASLPRTSWVAEIDCQAGIDGEADMAGHLRSLVPGQRAAQAGGEPLDCFGEGLADPFGGQAMRERKQ